MVDENEKILKNILEKNSLLFNDLISEIGIKLRDFTCYGSHRRFLVARLGSTGSTWLAKLLNSHPEVFCEHEGVLQKIYPKLNYGSDEIIQYIQTIAHDTHHNAYKASGDIGSIWLFHAIKLPKELFAAGLLIRHPARLLYTKVFTSRKAATGYNPSRHELLIEESIREIWGIDSSNFDDIDRLYLRNAHLWITQIARASELDVLIKIEEMNNLNYAYDILYRLTGVEYDNHLIENMANKGENVRSNQPESLKKLMAEFSPRQREWYRIIVHNIAEYIGYTV